MNSSFTIIFLIIISYIPFLFGNLHSHHALPCFTLLIITLKILNSLNFEFSTSMDCSTYTALLIVCSIGHVLRIATKYDWKVILMLMLWSCLRFGISRKNIRSAKTFFGRGKCNLFDKNIFRMLQTFFEFNSF